MSKNPALHFNLKKELFESFLIFLIGIPWGYLMCSTCENMIYPILISGVFWVTLWKGNQFLSAILDLKVSWVKAPLLRALTGVLGHSFITFILVTGIFKVVELFGITISNYKLTVLISIGITLVMTLILYARKFLLSWRQAAIDSERMQKEIITAKFETLKNQVNPHFLFNSLNTLTNLVFENQNTAAKFIKKLSEVYRYVLEVKDKELVKLEEEMNFVRSYVFLQKIRHENALYINENLNGLKESHNIMVPPLTLQLLIENAIKHNVLSSESPLNIDIYIKEERIFVENNLQIKNIIDENSTGVGLENIRSRYKYLSPDAIKINKDQNIFSVSLPLIKK
ncbi:histidine kinase [Mangrovivirga sp. M17]|uniref:Histidine kinase n=1 Tax=Mangrovivirga halotolerans TaxID=2993936 RepID=A0ABT3RMK7_9BACT|nr:histidine kinase [Mangrovivirga halotolerans]MCX2742800.1 histidine kinase [Mangrovivirga halotolerans]